MKNNNYKVFLILDGAQLTERTPIHVFISKDTEKSKLYFRNYLKENNKYGYYSLYTIAEVEKSKIIEKNLFITAYYNSTAQEKYESIQLHQKTIQEALKEKENKEIIKALFQAREIKCQ